MSTYRLNPFAVVTELPDGFMICGSNRHRVILPAKNREFVGELVAGTPMPPDVLDRYVSKRRQRELLAKNIILNGNSPPVEGRYSRQLGFFSLTTADCRVHQQTLTDAHVVILGAGGVGSHVAWNLAAMGIGRITIVDFDKIEETNLNRQLTYTPADIGQPKVEILCERLSAFNPSITLRPVHMKITCAADIAGLIADATVLVKAIDTPVESTSWANEACVNAGVPFIAGGFVDQVGIVGPLYIPGKSMCTSCVDPPETKRLHGTGPTLAPLVTFVGAMFAMCALRMIVGETDEIVDKIFSFDTRTGSLDTVPLSSTQPCKVCSKPPTAVEAPRASLDSRLWFYRGTIFTLMMVGALIFGFGHDRFTGLLMLAAFFASMPALDLIVAGDPRRFRREAFIMTCIYSVTNMVIFGLSRLSTLHLSFHVSLAGVFSTMQNIMGFVGATALVTTVLFAIAVLYVGSIKKLTNKGASWFA